MDDNHWYRMLKFKRAYPMITTIYGTKLSNRFLGFIFGKYGLYEDFVDGRYLP